MNERVLMPTMDIELSVKDLAAAIKAMPLEDLLEGIKSPGYPDRIGSYQYTHAGNLFFCCDPKPEEVFIKDIARGLSSNHRFNGQTKSRMTVAEHCYVASFVGGPEHCLERLLHDCAEGYIGDEIRPMKVVPIFGDIYIKIESGIERAVAERYNLTYPWPACVHVADEAVLKAEISQNIASKAVNHLSDASVKEADVFLYYWEPAMAEKMFLARFYELAAERGLAGF
jgi:hypothetical protein